MSGNVGQVFPPEWTEHDDPMTGRRVRQLTTKANNAKAYFTAPHFVDGGTTLIFTSDRTGTWEIFKLDMKSGQIVQLTDGADLSGANARISLCCQPHDQKPLAYAMAGRSERLVEIDTERGGSRDMLRIPEGFFGDLIVTSADGQRIASTYIQDLINVPNQLMTRDPKRIYSGGMEYMYRHPSSIVFVMDTGSGEAEAVWGDHEYLDHVQVCQADPDLLVFCHGSGSPAQRMWLIEARNYPGKKPRKFVPQKPGFDAAGHEFACPDGWIGFQYNQYTDGWRRGLVAHLGFADPRSDQFETFRLPGNRFGHFQATADRRRAIGDGLSRAGVETEPSDEWKIMTRYELRDGQAHGTPLCRHDSTFQTNESHPHPVFTPDEQHVVWASDRGGATHLYQCEFNE